MAAALPAPPFIRIGPGGSPSPIVFSVPHAGRSYSAELLAAARLPREKLETLEDPWVDRLVEQGVACRIVCIVAQTPRAEIDLNRHPREIDPDSVAGRLPAGAIVESARTRGGLGLVPWRLTGSGQIWLQRLQVEELQQRITHLHAPFHKAIATELAAARARFGIAMLVDLHSMPQRSGGRSAQIVLGDRHGGSCDRGLVELVAAATRGAGYRTTRNDPYAGGYITAHHGKPGEGIHALQIEIDRSLYLDADLRMPGSGFADIARVIGEVAQTLDDRLRGGVSAIAAE
jgi:N-formylglutamate amidohydrolase